MILSLSLSQILILNLLVFFIEKQWSYKNKGGIIAKSYYDSVSRIVYKALVVLRLLL